MPERVYECDKSEQEELKRILAYDPYLDTSLIPPEIKEEKIAQDKLTPEQKTAIEERSKKVAEANRFLSENPKGKYIFARQQCEIKDGAALGLNGSMCYLYINATEDFLNGAELRFKNEFKSVKRAAKDAEEKVINAIKEEQERANLGFGSIFGN